MWKLLTYQLLLSCASHVLIQAKPEPKPQGGLVIIEVPTATAAPATTAGSVVIINPAVVANCQCTAPANCADGAANLNPRIVNNIPAVVCAAGQIYCCNLVAPNPTTTAAPATTTISPATCGIRTIITTTYLPRAGEASFGEYPWTVLIYRVSDGALIGTGALIDGNTVLTAAHKVAPGTDAMRVRLGEYILNAVSEPNPFVEIAVSAVRINTAFNSVNLQNGIAILKLATAVNFVANPHIHPICLPAAGQVFNGQRCWVAGFGANSFTSNQYQTVMKEIDLPVLDGPTCQARYAATRLGATFVFNQQSFICAGGEVGRDACTGDGGAALACLVGTSWVAAGLVSWGLECGLTNVPGAYVNLVNFLPWIAANRG